MKPKICLAVKKDVWGLKCYSDWAGDVVQW
jgi:hypothetical protein